MGIVASRLSEKYACPSFMIHLKDGVGKGSCRSYGGFNLFSALESCADLLEGFGGHELAAGFTISEENIDAFRARMNRYVRSASGGERAVSCLDVDAPISCPGEVTLAEVEQLDQLEPYGAGNPRPVFALLGATVDVLQPVGQGKHLKLRLSKGTCRFDAIFFSMTEETCGVAAGMRVDAAFYLQANTFRGNTTPAAAAHRHPPLPDPQPPPWGSGPGPAPPPRGGERASPGRSGPGSRRPAASSPPFGPCWAAAPAGERRRRRCCPFCGGCRHSPAGVRASSGRPGPGRVPGAGPDRPVRPGGPGDAFAESHPGEGGSLRLPLSVPPAGGRRRQEWRCCVATIQEQYENLEKTVRGYNPAADFQHIRAAFEFAAEAHKDQKRKSGEPYIIHPLAVAQIVAEELRLDSESIEAALLHDVIEDTAATHEQVSKLFSPTIADLVEGVSKLTRIQYATKEDEQMENLRKMLIAMSKDIRVILIKISDRLHNMRTMEYQSPAKQKQKSLETMEIYAPIAHRLGMQRIKWELEDLSLKYLDPIGYEEIVSKLEAKHQEYEGLHAPHPDPDRRPAEGAGHRSHRLRPDEASLLHLPEDVQPEQEPGRDLRPVRLPGDCEHGGGLLQRFGGHP